MESVSKSVPDDELVPSFRIRDSIRHRWHDGVEPSTVPIRVAALRGQNEFGHTRCSVTLEARSPAVDVQVVDLYMQPHLKRQSVERPLLSLECSSQRFEVECGLFRTTADAMPTVAESRGSVHRCGSATAHEQWKTPRPERSWMRYEIPEGEESPGKRRRFF